MRESQSRRPASRAPAIVASAPGIIAPYSCPKLPRMPQPTESDKPVASSSQSGEAESDLSGMGLWSHSHAHVSTTYGRTFFQYS